ncbi:MAG: winged helix DNA-binding domain-containing protein, partial [Burkholderiales bacterium]|nr:winged helix DNA-binding domain-containing protein [Burkholderiales bacterium]
APARAQDLILRHRVNDYRADDLEKKYASLPLVEDSIYNYGFFHRDELALLHPRTVSPRWLDFMAEHAALRRAVLRYLKNHEHAHPRDLEKALASGGRVNGWGGSSSATTLLLEGLHREGRVHVQRRDAGIRVYAAAPKALRALSGNARADGLVQLMVNLYAPAPLRSLMKFARVMSDARPGVDCVKRFELMIKRGKLRAEKIDHVTYVWPAEESMPDAVDEQVRLLTPFDPVVWDRLRFEHLWGWRYRFEAYTPVAKRKLGYYALPLLWRDDVIGWGNVETDAKGKLNVKIGYALRMPSGSDATIFKRELDKEIERLREFSSAK